ncbi:hypothetical protein ANN_28057, partial [Periplaneta americana]
LSDYPSIISVYNNGKETRKWGEENMKGALQNVLSGKMTIRQAAVSFSVPRSSLGDRVLKVKSGSDVKVCADMGRFKPTFSENYEEEFVKHIKDLDNRMMPLTKKEFLKLTFDLAETLRILHRFNKEKKRAGKDFYYNFLKRHPNLSLQTAESTSSQRAVGFNRPQVSRFFDKLGDLQNQFHFPASRIFNADETGISCVHINDTKVLSVKGKKQVGKLTSGERGRTITVLLCVNASGDQFLPPLFVFPRQRMNNRLMINAPSGSLSVAHETGWITADSFMKWFVEFVKCVHPTTEDPVLLILDGHSSHKELNVILYARNSNVHMLSLPPHTTHRLQPLDRTVMKPFKNAYNEACAEWMRRNPFSKITVYEVSELVNVAFSRICHMDLVKKGNCGPEDSERTVEDVRQLPEVQEASASKPVTTLCTAKPSTSSQLSPISSSKQSSSGFITPPSCSKPLNLHLDSASTSTSKSHSTTSHLTPSFSRIIKQISPIPEAAQRRLNVRRRRAARSEILTSSPYKAQLEEKQALKKSEKVKKRLMQDSINKRATRSKQELNTKGGKIFEGETECIICCETFQEDWIKCDFCQGWAHENCANTESTTEFYKCDSCEIKEKTQKLFFLLS